MKMKLSLIIRTLQVIGALTSYLLVTPNASADSHASFTPSLLYFKYIEFGNSGEHFDKESGFLPGFKIAFIDKNDFGYYLQGGFDYFAGKINYDGMIQTSNPTDPLNGAAFSTKTYETLKHFYLGLGKTIGSSRYPTNIGLRIAYSSWDREIQAKDGVDSGHEYYQWNEVGINLSQIFINRPAGILLLSEEVFRVTAPSMTLDLSQYGANSPKLALREKLGYRAGLEWKKSGGEKFQYSVGLFYEYYAFGASAVTNSAIGGIYEPDSTTQKTSLQFKLIKSF